MSGGSTVNPVKRLLKRLIGDEEDPVAPVITPFIAKHILPRMAEMDEREERMRTNVYEREYLRKQREDR